MRVSYNVNARTIRDEDGLFHTMYGVDAISEDGIVINSVIDIFENFEKAKKFATRCTELELVPEHLQDVIEDALIS